MDKPHWELLHDWGIEDVKYWLEEIYAYKLMLRIHPDDKMSAPLRDIIKQLKKALEQTVKKYEITYGDKPNVRNIRNEVEGNV